MRVGEGMRGIAITVAMLVAVPAMARPLDIYNGMRDLPITHFKKADIDLMTQTVNRAMDSGEDGVTVKWESPGTPNGGSVTPEKDPQGRKGCRLARIENHHGSLQNTATYVLCRNQDKSTAKATPWKVVGLSN
jgi:surface antigen